MAEGYSIPAQYTTGTMDISGANAVEVIFARHFKLLEIRVFVSVVTATADETMTVTRRVVPGQSTSAVNIGTFVVPSGLAVGSERRISTASIADTLFNSGEGCHIICGNSTGTGTVYFGLIGYHYDGDNLNPQTSFTTTSTKAVASGAGTISYGAMTAT